ncbi:MAG: NAD(P)H-dependent oxidoreductase subunit E [Candidatus Nealsonbacteria bacterium]|nr:NAD(P)H-dependent oxidoreductase subunit E [Candidatus Nealsonbacteria bacterium]
MSVKVTVCVGSSCHVRGSRAVLKRFAEIIKTEQLEDKVQLQDEVELLGSFCMERCGETMSWKFNDDEITSLNVEDAEATLREKLSETLKES